MSAIWGIIDSFRSKNEREKLEEQMKAVYEGRCKLDRLQMSSVDNACFACGIQHITCEAVFEELPYYEASTRIVFTADCIVDNRKELLEELLIDDMSMPDGTILRKAYEKWGIDFLQHVIGMFAVAIYDETKNKLYLAVDQISQRCLYYRVEKESVYFSTLIDPIRRVTEGIEENLLYDKDFLLAPGMMPNLVPGETPYEGIMQMKPGTYVEIADGQVREQVYWNLLDHIQPVKTRNAKQCGKRFIKKYEQCVERLLRTDGEVAICLSSGYDSSSVAALASKILDEEGKKLFAFTYVPYEKSPKKTRDYFIEDETSLVKELAAMYPNIETNFVTNEGKCCLEELDYLLQQMEIPVKAFVNFPNLMEIYRKAKERGCKVVLSGQSGNGTVSYGNIEGVLYHLYRENRKYAYTRVLHGYCKKIVPQSRLAARKQMKEYFKYADRRYGAKKQWEPEKEHPFLNERVWDDYPEIDRFSYIKNLLCYQDLPDTRQLRDEQLASPSSYMYIGAYETKLGLESGVVIRDPTRQTDMLEFVCGMPYEYFCSGGNVRWLVRGAMKSYFPASFVNVWPRYGVQNIDWYLRLFRDWEQWSESIRRRCLQGGLSQWVKTEKVEELLSELEQMRQEEGELTEDQEAALQMLLFLYSYSLFCEKRREPIL